MKQHLEFKCLFEQHEKTQAGQFAAHKKHVEREITKRPVAMPLVSLVARQGFASENIRKSISEAAQKAAAAQAKELMETTIKPVTDQALTDIQQHRNEVSTIAQKMKQDTKNIAGQLHTEVSQQAAQKKAALESLRREYTKEVGDHLPARFNSALGG